MQSTHEFEMQTVGASFINSSQLSSLFFHICVGSV